MPLRHRPVSSSANMSALVDRHPRTIVPLLTDFSLAAHEPHQEPSTESPPVSVHMIPSIEKTEGSQNAPQASVRPSATVVVRVPILRTPLGSTSGDEPPRGKTPSSSESDVSEMRGSAKLLVPGRIIAVPKSRRRPSRSPSVENSVPPA